MLPAVALLRNSRRAVTETARPAKPTIFTIWLSTESLQTLHADTVIYALFNAWDSAVWWIAGTHRARSTIYTMNMTKEGSSLSKNTYHYIRPYIRHLVFILKVYYYNTYFAGKVKLSKVSHLPEVVEVGFGLRSDSRTPWSFYCSLIPPSCLLLPFPWMAELWLVLRGGLRILREKQKGL